MNDSALLQQIIANFCPWPPDQINLGIAIKDRYVPAEAADQFSDGICQQWPDIDCTALHNQMFSGLKTGNDILTFIQSA